MRLLDANRLALMAAMALQRALFTCMAPAGAIQQRLHLKVAEGVAAGSVDLAEVDALIGQLDKAADGVRACSIKPLEQLHAVLTPEERSELGDKVQANLEVWQQVTSRDGQVGRGPGDRLGRLTKEVALTPAQVEQATAALHTALSGQSDRYERSKVEEDVQAFDAAFEQATFDASAAIRYTDPRTASHGATRMAIFYETVTPLLTPAQRAVLAERLRARAAGQPET